LSGARKDLQVKAVQILGKIDADYGKRVAATLNISAD